VGGGHLAREGVGEVSEDEAFIRAIVDSPGDDTPRLVYADWLDDRSDPRGAYLRAEREIPGDVARLSEMGVGLDLVWVSRVSRPPVGVCCETTAFQHQGPPLSSDDLSHLESRLDIEIGGDYRAFLLNYNGGCPRSVCEERSEPRFQGGNIFYAVGPPAVVPLRCSVVQHITELRAMLPDLTALEMWDAGPDDEPWVEDVVPIADTWNQFQLFFASRGRYRGLLHLHDWTGDVCRFGFVGWPPTLPQLLHKLPDGGYGISDTYPSQPLQDFWRT
jgi:uncharacterized protein (TIGR02996 family)